MSKFYHTHQEVHHRCVGGHHERAGEGGAVLGESALQLVEPREVQQILHGCVGEVEEGV